MLDRVARITISGTGRSLRSSRFDIYQNAISQKTNRSESSDGSPPRLVWRGWLRSRASCQWELIKHCGDEAPGTTSAAASPPSGASPAFQTSPVPTPLPAGSPPTAVVQKPSASDVRWWLATNRGKLASDHVSRHEAHIILNSLSMPQLDVRPQIFTPPTRRDTSQPTSDWYFCSGPFVRIAVSAICQALPSSDYFGHYWAARTHRVWFHQLAPHTLQCHPPSSSVHCLSTLAVPMFLLTPPCRSRPKGARITER